MALFRRTTDLLAEAVDITSGVISAFQTAVDDLEYAQALAAEEALVLQEAIDGLRDRQKLANTAADQAGRVAEKIAALVA